MTDKILLLSIAGHGSCQFVLHNASILLPHVLRTCANNDTTNNLSPVTTTLAITYCGCW